MDEGLRGNVHLAADIVHLLAAGAWLGGLLAFVLMVFRRSRSPAELALIGHALERFAITGTVAVGALILSGLVDSWLLIGPDHLPQLWTSLYGRLLLVKIGIFLAMLALAASNRFRLTPALERGLAVNGPARAVAALRNSLALEGGAALAVLGLVAWLGTLSPPVAG